MKTKTQAPFIIGCVTSFRKPYSPASRPEAAWWIRSIRRKSETVCVWWHQALDCAAMRAAENEKLRRKKTLIIIPGRS